MLFWLLTLFVLSHACYGREHSKIHLIGNIRFTMRKSGAAISVSIGARIHRRHEDATIGPLSRLSYGTARREHRVRDPVIRVIQEQAFACWCHKDWLDNKECAWKITQVGIHMSNMAVAESHNNVCKDICFPVTICNALSISMGFWDPVMLRIGQSYA